LLRADWLIERRIITSSWQKALRVAHTKLEAALEAERPPVDGVAALLPAGRTQRSTTYFECVRVLELLKAAGMDEKSFLGAYTNAHTARWADVVKRFESSSVFLVDTAQFLTHGVFYELPALRQEISRAEKELAELVRRQSEYNRLADASHARFVAACSHRKIHSESEDAGSLRSELRASLSQLRPLYEQVARLAQQPALTSAAEEYRSLVAFALEKIEDVPPPAAAAASEGTGGKGGKGGKKAKGSAAAAKAEAVAALEVTGGGEGGDGGGAPAAKGAAAGDLLPMLTRIQQLDLSLLSDLADQAAEQDVTPAGAASGSAAAEVDWGIEADEGGTAAGGGGGVDWGIEADEGGTAAGGGVDWGDGGGGEIDFEIELEASGEEGTEEDLSLARLLEQSSTRNQLLDDLFELHGFLSQYTSGLDAGASASVLPATLQLDAKEAGARLSAVSSAIDLLDSEHTRHLLLLSTSESYLDRQVASLRQMLDSSEKMRRRADELHARQAELGLMIQSMQPRCATAVAAMKLAKEQLEDALSKRFDGRRVNLMGEVNSL
jgi:hypothetical protein